jgi:GDP/UDP-N,N'-diacetylbacillosamine 2-epimerase (hydrolysing)
MNSNNQAATRANKRVCVVTGSRSEYGLLRWLIQEIDEDAGLDLKLIVTGSHLSPEFGNTIDDIVGDGFTVDAKVEMLLSSASKSGIAKSMGVCAMGVAEALDRLAPQVVVVLGDRYELIPVCGSALVMRIPIAHISGGDITEGAIDDQIRHAVTKMASIHFPGTRESANRIVQMGEPPDRVFVVGEPGLESFRRVTRLDRSALARDLGLAENQQWVLLTFHPETSTSIQHNLDLLQDCLKALEELQDVQIVATYPNSDYGSKPIIDRLRQWAAERSCVTVVKNLGQMRFISLMSEVVFMIGNSSSGIVESPMAGVGAINLGDRQKGRYQCRNVVQVSGAGAPLRAAIRRVMAPDFSDCLKDNDSPYGDGQTSIRIKEILKTVDWTQLLTKPFVIR